MSAAEEQDNKGSEGSEAGATRCYYRSVIQPGGQIGPFRIEQELGRGAMGVVYLAHDTKLDRPVAIKTLPAELTEHPTARSRLEREARVLASLNHPHIATIYEELQEAEGVSYLVLEYVAGQTLADMIARVRLKPQEALSLAQRIAEAVSAAHEHGVIHRDLKPGNIKLTPEGKIKVLDFGLAKVCGTEAVDKQSTVTEPGRVMGTPAYMSPEQVRGLQADKRCDIWAFGCVLYEMLTGKVPFQGATVSDTLVGILDREPDWSALPPTTPTNIRVLLRRCLEKDLCRRLHDIADAAIEISETLSGALEELTLPGRLAPAPRLFRRQLILTALVCSVAGVVMAAAIFISLVMPGPPPAPDVVRIPLNAPAAIYSGASPNRFVAISPDGTRLVYVGESDKGDPQLYTWSMDSLPIKTIPGTLGAHNPFFSSDGRQIAFFTTDKQLKRVLVEGGEPQTLLEDIPDGRFAFGSWADQTIVFSIQSGNRGLQQIPDVGAQHADTLVSPASQDERVYYCYPQVLPDGKAVLYSCVDPNGSCIWAYRPTMGRSQLVLKDASYARYVNSGHLIFVRENVLMVAPFDLGQLKPGRAVRWVNDDVEFDNNTQTPQIAVSDNGTVVYITGAELGKRELVWVDRQGTRTSLEAEADVYEAPCLSRDGHRIAVGIRSQEDRDIRVCVYDIGLHRFFPLTMESGGYPQWSPDGKSIAYWGRASGLEHEGLFCKGVGTGADLRLLASSPSTGVYLHPYSWSRNLLACTAWPPHTQQDIWVVDTDGQQEPTPIVATHEREYDPAFSPDGRWLAYVLERSGQPQIYLWEYPAGEKLPVSTTGGTNPVWSRDGQELYYISGDSMMVAKVTPESDFPIGRPERLFALPDEIESRGRGLVRNYDVSSDGRFLMLKRSGRPGGQLIYVQNWFEELKRLAPPGRSR